MNTNFTETDLIDYLSGELEDSKIVALEKAVQNDESLHQRLEEYRGIYGWLNSQDKLISSYSEDEFLRSAAHHLQNSSAESKSPRLRILRYSAIAASILLVFSLGWWLGGSSVLTNTQDFASQWEELLEGERSSHRIAATRLIASQPNVDEALISRLGILLREDPSPNVRLAALEALATLGQYHYARQELIMSLEPNGPAAVQIQLIEILIELEETKILPRLHDWSQDLSLPQYLRDAAELGRFKLDKI
ncbi:MAG: hypothetical protein AAF741_07215 [Bacteroidota bacterium]